MALFGWMLAIAYLILPFRHRERAIGPFLIPFVSSFSVLGVLLPSHAPPRPATRGSLFAFHVTLAILANAAFALSFVLSLLYLIQNRQIRRGRTGVLFSRLPALEVIGRMNRTSVTIGLVAPRALRGARPGVGAPRLEPAGRREARLGDLDPLGLWLSPLDGPAGLGGPEGRAPLDRGLRPGSLLLHVRQPVPLAGARLPMSGAREGELLVLGWNFRGASGRLREGVAFTAEEVREGLRRLLGRGLVSRA